MGAASAPAVAISMPADVAGLWSGRRTGENKPGAWVADSKSGRFSPEAADCEIVCWTWPYGRALIYSGSLRRMIVPARSTSLVTKSPTG